ncbi:L-aminopeptidase/D-esterase [Faunimonas pinastri]|uniref:L-aminopeptidase/D-esterase n=1 Tax=Faunimonas pinastri TaxID=1855383 RepID=A0A1H9D358_9HYPH|nr:P1 family peptidase [Faunimonas pinastri]SEQ07273.1 L-aminopeptidase/D-esterase [Faunimonas pinastri]
MSWTHRTLPGLRIGHASDRRLKSGTTVFLPDEPALAAVHVAGGAPGTRETDLLVPENTVDRVDAIVLSGGSAFGLAAADGVSAWLAARGRGFAIGPARVPIVPAAILFDLLNGGDKASIPGMGSATHSPYAGLGRAACEAASAEVELGSAGVGIGATIADLKGGFGMASAMLPGGGSVVAHVGVNAVGRVTLGSTAHFRAAPFEIDDEFGGLGYPRPFPPDAAAAVTKMNARAAGNTTIAVIATDVAIGKAQAKRVAIAAHDGFALAIFPAHTPMDGDTVFVLSTGRIVPDDPAAALADLCTGAVTAMTRAVARGVYEASAAAGDRLPAWRDRYSVGVEG